MERASPRQALAMECTRYRALCGPGDGDEDIIDDRRIEELPALASTFFFPDADCYGWSPTLKTILEGTHDEQSPLVVLRGVEVVLSVLYSFLTPPPGSQHVTLTLPAYAVGTPHFGSEDKLMLFIKGRGSKGRFQRQYVDSDVVWKRRQEEAAKQPHDRGEDRRSRRSVRPLLKRLRRGGRHDKQKEKCKSNPAPEIDEADNQTPLLSRRGVQPDPPIQGLVSFARLGIIKTFPEPKDQNVNMMPFVFGNRDSLPEDLQCYYDLIEQCPYEPKENGKVGYLTVHESYVEATKAQRREGIHIEAPGVLYSDDQVDQSVFTPGVEHSWGCGVFFGSDRLQGGIFMASTVEDTSEVWDALVDKSIPRLVDHHGGCEHLRPVLGPGTKLKANELIWMTDCTPHEAIPQTESGYRQFFRVVTSHVSHWFAHHSTPNPLVPVPDYVTVVHGSKFGKAKEP